MELSSLDVERLRVLYSKKTQELKDALLAGALWHEVEPQRKAVTDIGIVLHKKLLEAGTISPAEFAVRKDDFNSSRSED